MSYPDPVPETNPSLASRAHRQLLEVLENLATGVPHSEEPVSANPAERAKGIVRMAGIKAGSVSAGLALPPGPLGLLTIIPDLVKVWQIQRQMVADIAACFGKSAQLKPQMMVYCLFRHGSAILVRDMVARVGERMIVQETGLRAIQQILRRIGIRISQKTVGKSLSRCLPVLGPALIGGYSFLDTRAVGRTAIDAFGRRIVMVQGEPDEA